MPDLADDVTQMALKVFERLEFRHYVDYQDQLLRRLRESRLAEIETKTGASRADWISKLEQAGQLRHRKGTRARKRAVILGGLASLTAAGWIALLSVPLATLAQRLGVDPHHSWISRHHTTLVVWLVITSIVAAGSCIAQTMRRVNVLRTLLVPVDDARGLYLRTLDSSVQEAISTAINDELGPKGIVAFPTHAPRLVELDSSQITPSQTTKYIRDFIIEHEASAIGLAGTRGSGKSTVMRALKADRHLGLVRIVPSPVRYDPGEFLRLLLGQVASAIVSYPDANGTRRRIRTMPVRTMSTLLVVATGFVTLLALLTLKNIPPTIILGVAVGVAAGSLVNLQILFKMIERSQPSDIRLAREILRDLNWETERGLTAKSTLKLQSLFESSGESSLKLKRRAYTRSDVVDALRQLLARFADRRRPQRLVVCIDELDKLDTVDHLVEIVNELKDLFHVQRVHFVVAVSTDALESFEKRGLSSRDAFDSALDTIVHTGRLTLEESLAVVASRATGFAPLIAMFCHAWSGGLARDLLRAGRSLVDQQRGSRQGPLSLMELIEHLVYTDLYAAIRASMQTLEPGDDQIEALWSLRKTLEGSRSSPLGAIHTMSDLAFNTPTLQALHAKAQLGMSLLHLAHTAQSLPTYWDNNSPAIQALATQLSEHAVAVSEINAPAPIRDAAVDLALRTLGPSVAEGHRHPPRSAKAAVSAVLAILRRRRQQP